MIFLLLAGRSYEAKLCTILLPLRYALHGILFFAKVEYVFLFPPPPQTKYDSVKAKKSLPILPTDSSQLDGVTFDLSATPLQFTSPLKMIV